VSGDQNHRWQVQASIYKSMLEACLEAGVCKGFTMWGFADMYSWLVVGTNATPNSEPTMFDDQLQPKPAYFAVRDVLSGWGLATPSSP
jgi:endo-1,4-beta-xylanase